MRHDIVYFRSSFAPEAAEGPVGWHIANVIRTRLEAEGWTCAAPQPSWNGVTFCCTSGPWDFDLEVTPYFEAKPLEWSIEVRPVRLARLFGRRTHDTLAGRLHHLLTSDKRFTVLKWDSLDRLAREHQRGFRTCQT